MEWFKWLWMPAPFAAGRVAGALLNPTGRLMQMPDLCFDGLCFNLGSKTAQLLKLSISYEIIAVNKKYMIHQSWILKNSALNSDIGLEKKEGKR